MVLEVEVEGEDVDLNRATEIELRLAKTKMEEKFSKNRILPGAPGYEYDKQVRVLLGSAKDPQLPPGLTAQVDSDLA